MILLENISVFNWENAIRGMRNPMNSWSQSDSYDADKLDRDCSGFIIGPNDLALMRKLVKAGSDHRKFLRQIFVSVDITAPLYWWKEYDTYKVGTTANSCSTMHKIHAKEFTLDDFSHEHLNEGNLIVLKYLITVLNDERRKFLDIKEKDNWWQMIQLLPSSYNQKRTCTMTYENLLNMYSARRHHKLDEWHVFCDMIESLPNFERICLDGRKDSRIIEAKCPHCGKNFILNRRSIYKLKKKGKIVYYCGYNCWSANDNRKYDFVKGRYID